MGIEDLKTINFADVLAKYEGRNFIKKYNSPPVRKVDIPDRPGFESRLQSSALVLWNLLKDKNFNSPDGLPYFDDPSVHAFSECIVLDPNIPITLIARKECGVDSKTGENMKDYYNFTLLNTDGVPSEQDSRDLQIGNFSLVKLDGGFGLPHRVVKKAFQGQKFGTSLLNLSSAFVQAVSNDFQKDQYVDCEAAQLDVIFLLIKNGFVPATEKDESMLKMVLEGSEELCVIDGYYFFHTSVSLENRTVENMNNAFRIRFKKDVTPKKDDVVDTGVDEVRGGLDEAFRDVLDETSSVEST